MLFALFNYLKGFAPSAQPAMSRAGYRRELISFSTLPFATALIEGSVVAVLAKLRFGIDDFGFATIIAAPMFANLTSGMWAKFVRGRPKAAALATIQFLLILLIASIALLPTDSNGWGPTALVVLVVVGRCLVAGMINVRSVIWRANYRKDRRAQITGRFTMITALLLAIVPFATYSWLDGGENRFRILYPVGAAIGLISVIAVAKLRVRREQSLLDFERQENAEPFPDQDPADPTTLQRQSFIEVLKRDELFRTYMLWQFVAGMANMAGNVAVVRLIVGLIEDKYPHAAYGTSTLLTATLPMVMMTLTIPLWARFLDGVHIARFRMRQSVLWIISQLLYLGAGFTGNPLHFILPRMFQGVIFGGGALAWQLGHHDFADRRLAATYMGIHQMLTGIRGAVAPYMGVLLLAGWDNDSKIARGIGLPEFHGIGSWVFAITTAGCIVALIGFARLTKQVEAAEGK